jgi:predicted Ser/Thr protein kinase
MTRNVNACPNCSKPLPPGALGGLCPACLLAQGADTDPGGPPDEKGFKPLPLEEVAKLFPSLEILSLLGAGGMGAVYKARQPALDRMVALKILPPKGAAGVNFAERFNAEARALARLNHPSIVGVHEFGQVDGLHFFIMEFVDGANLRQLEKAGQLSPRETLQIIPQICDALQYAHDEGVVHRDIKPENVLVDRKGRVKIADFGLAKILGRDPELTRLTVEGQVMGTPHYMAPEQVERPLSVDHRADIYSLGVVLYEMLTGDLPLGKFSPPSRKVEVDVRFDEIVLRALENDPERRYQHASEIKSGVQTIADTPTPAFLGAPASLPAFCGDGQRMVHWADFPVAIERDGKRRVNWTGTFLAFAVIFGLLTIGFAFVSAVFGRSLMGWIGIIGWPSVVARLLIAALIVSAGVWRTLHRPFTLQGTAILTRKRPWWRSRKVVLPAILLVAASWTLFQEKWLGAHDVVVMPLITAGDETISPVATKLRQEASVELWAPLVKHGELPDPSAVLNEARQLMQAGKYEEALQRHIWYHNHAVAIQPSQSAVRLSFALADWAELARRYPKAKQALIEIRDQKTRLIVEGRGYADLFSDVNSINYYLQKETATVALFKHIHEKDPALARQCVGYARDALVNSREYALVAAYIPDAQADFDSMIWFWKDDLSRATSLKDPEGARRSANQRFVVKVSQLIEILAGAGRKAEAEQIRGKALALIEDGSFANAGLAASLKAAGIKTEKQGE